jgi:hypothetical protein
MPRRVRRDPQRARSEGVRRQLRAREARRSGQGGAFARPLEFDESGFPIIERPPSFTSRVARLLSGKLG